MERMRITRSFGDLIYIEILSNDAKLVIDPNYFFPCTKIRMHRLCNDWLFRAVDGTAYLEILEHLQDRQAIITQEYVNAGKDYIDAVGDPEYKRLQTNIDSLRIWTTDTYRGRMCMKEWGACP